MQQLRVECGAGTLTKVIRQALLLFDWYSTYRRQRYVLQMKSPSGQTVEAPELHPTF
jgi:hypothetical protein